MFQLTINSCVCVARQRFRCGRSRIWVRATVWQRFGNGLGVEGQGFRCGRSKAFGVAGKRFVHPARHGRLTCHAWRVPSATLGRLTCHACEGLKS